MQGGSPWATSRMKTHFVWPTVFFKNWTELPTITQKYGFWALLLKNGKIWQYQITLLPCNDGQDLRSNVQTNHFSLVLPSITWCPSLGSTHFGFLTGPTPVPLLWVPLSPLQVRWILNKTLKDGYRGCAILLLHGEKPQQILYPLSDTAPFLWLVSRTAQRVLPSVFWNQDGSSSHLVSFIIYLMNEFTNLDGLASRVALLQNEMTTHRIMVTRKVQVELSALVLPLPLLRPF